MTATFLRPKLVTQRRTRRHKGFSLVVVLAMIILVTVVVMAFFTRAMANRQTEISHSNQVEACQLASSAVDYAASQLLSEITSDVYSTAVKINGSTIYSPLKNTSIVPRRALSRDIQLSDTNFWNLLRQSVPEADTHASSDNTASPSRNGRKIDAQRWNAPLLLSGGFSSENQLPHWIYVTSDHGLTNIPSPNVIGRFAYNIYDIGGLLNANSSGYDPAVITGSASANLKSSTAGIDLTQLGLSEKTASDLINFRNTIHDTRSDYLDRMNTSARSGFLDRIVTNSTTGNVYTNNLFTGRQDLIRYARTQNPTLVSALPYFTHFARTVNAPSWTPAKVTNRNPDFSISIYSASHPSVRHYNDDGTSFIYSVQKGDPLIPRKFSLAKLAWLTPSGPADPSLVSAIQACFGLMWNESEERWNYVGAYGSQPLSEIATLSEISQEPTPREPNFFELLKACIAEGSLGMATDTIPSSPAKSNYPSKTTAADSHFGNSSFGNNILDGNKDLHLLRIGANIIDCADADNYPTILALQYGSIPVEVAGIEDLPYLYCLNLVRLNTLSNDGLSVTNCDLLWVPEFFNPHRTSPSPSTSGPSSISFGIASGKTYRVFWVASDQTLPSPILLTGADYPSIVLDAATIADSRNGPIPMRDNSAPNHLGALVSYIDPAYAEILGYLIYSYEKSFASTFGEGSWPAPLNPKSSACPGADHTQVVVHMQYLSPKGQWKTYSNPLGGHDAFPETGLDGLYPDDRSEATFKYGNSWISVPQINSLTRMMYLATGDCRTGRFGASTGRYNRALSAPPSFKGDMSHYEMFTFHPYNPASGFLGFWGQHSDTSTLTLSTVPDVDGVKRPADGYLGGTTSAGPANPYRDLKDMDRRPVILQRPYRTVAELGYVFRDAPCKTLNFFHVQSGDGALIDVFSVQDQPSVTSGRVRLDTPHVAIRNALLSHGGDLPDGTTSTLFDTATPQIARSLGNFSRTSDGAAAETILFNVGQLPSFVTSSSLSSALPTNSFPIKYKREAIVRSLAESTQTRTWNILADVIAQSGRFPSDSAPDPDNFQVEAEQRCWFSAAIDRFSARVVDSQLEKIHE